MADRDCSREWLLHSIVGTLSAAEEAVDRRGKHREWLREAYAFARECVDGPPEKTAEDFLAAIANE